MVSQPLARTRDRERIDGRAAFRLPVPPVAAVVLVVQRAKQRVVVEPPALALGERLERAARDPPLPLPNA